MPDKHLHIVCLDVPYPPDYGGVFDLFFKIKSLHESGVKIHLHCFEYGRGKQSELNQYCEEVHYYKRIQSIRGVISVLPYIVSSRANPKLLQNLLRDNYPVLLEGIHCTYYLYSGQLANRKVIVRQHNVEYEYYQQLANSTRNISRKIYFIIESRRLKKYEAELANKAPFLSVNEKDKITYQREFQCNEIDYLPVFLPFDSVQSKTGKGTFCLYQGNLSVPENEKAVIWLLENVFQTENFELIVAGKNPSVKLQRMFTQKKNVKLVANPSQIEMDNLIKNAHIHLLPSFNSTGIKIKLLNALFDGRFIITNAASVDGTQLKTLCTIAETAEEYQQQINRLFTEDFTQENINHRSELLKNQFNNAENANRLINQLFPD